MPRRAQYHAAVRPPMPPPTTSQISRLRRSDMRFLLRRAFAAARVRYADLPGHGVAQHAVVREDVRAVPGGIARDDDHVVVGLPHERHPAIRVRRFEEDFRHAPEAHFLFEIPRGLYRPVAEDALVLVRGHARVVEKIVLQLLLAPTPAGDRA